MAIFARVGLVSNCIKAVLEIHWRILRSGVTLQWEKGARRSLLNWRRVMYARSTPVLMCHWISATWLFLREAARRISQEEWWDVQGENQLLGGRPFIFQSLIHTAVAFNADMLLSAASSGPQEPWVEGWESHANLISSKAGLATFPKLFSSA